MVLFRVFPVVPDILHVVVVFEHVQHLLHVLDVFFAGQLDGAVLRQHLNLSAQQRVALCGQSFSHGSNVADAGTELGTLLII